RLPAYVVLGLTSLTSPIYACDYHELLDLPEPVGTWAASTKSLDLKGLTSLSIQETAESLAARTATVLSPSITSWKLNTTNAKGHSTDATINSYVSSITADVDRVAYDSTYAYEHSSDVPS